MRVGPVATALMFLVRAYRWGISPLLGPACRFEPSCSSYALTALETYGAWRGLWLTVRRVLSCRPGGRSGYDPVPVPPSRMPRTTEQRPATTDPIEPNAVEDGDPGPV